VITEFACSLDQRPGISSISAVRYKFQSVKLDNHTAVAHTTCSNTSFPTVGNNDRHRCPLIATQAETQTALQLSISFDPR